MGKGGGEKRGSWFYSPEEDDGEVQSRPSSAEVALGVEDAGVGDHTQDDLHHVDCYEDETGICLCS